MTGTVLCLSLTAEQLMVGNTHMCCMPSNSKVRGVICTLIFLAC
jgi:hypothetical protein